MNVFSADQLVQAQSKSKKRDVLCEFEHVVTHNKIWMSLRLDRSILMVIWEQSKQILQIRLEMFGVVPSDGSIPPLEDAAVVKAKYFMLPLAEAYANNQITSKAALIQARDEKILRLALALPKHVMTRKRPAAALEETSASSSSKAKQSVANHDQEPDAVDTDFLRNIILLKNRHMKAHGEFYNL